MALKTATVHVSGSTIFTGPGQTVDVSWYAQGKRSTTIPSGQTLGGVRWRVVVNGVAGAWTTITSKTTRRPDFSDELSRTPGVSSLMAPFPGYGVTIAGDAYSTGKLVVEADVLDSTLAPESSFDPVTIWNDKDGINRQPAGKLIFCIQGVGNDANDGSLPFDAGGGVGPVNSLHRAIYLSKANPAGSTAADRDCGGSVILAQGDFTGGGTYAPGQWHCSPGTWLTIIATGTGMTWGRVNSPFSTDPDDYVSMTGNGSGTVCALRTIRVTYLGQGPIGRAPADVSPLVWSEGDTHQSKHWDPTKPLRAIYKEDDGGIIWTFAKTSDGASHPAARVYATCLKRQGSATGLNGYKFAYDFSVEGYLGQGLYVAGDSPSQKYLCGNLQKQSYTASATTGVLGYVRHTGGTGFEIQVLGGGTARLLGPVSGYDFGADAADIISSTYWGVGLYSFPGGNDGIFPVVATGVTGGRSYIDYTNPSATAVTGTASSNIETSTTVLGTGPYNQKIHPDGIFYQGVGRPPGDLTAHISFILTKNQAQSLFFGGGDQQGLCVDNVRDDGGNWDINFGDASITDSLFINCSLSGTLFIWHQLASETLSFAGTQFINCVFRQGTAEVAQAILLGAEFINCHWVTGTAFGTDPTTGAFFNSDPTAPPYSMEPTSGNKGTGSVMVVDPSEWAWSPSGSTRGVLKNVGLVDWSLGLVPPVLTAASPPTVAVSPGGAASLLPGGRLLANDSDQSWPLLNVHPVKAIASLRAGGLLVGANGVWPTVANGSTLLNAGGLLSADGVIDCDVDLSETVVIMEASGAVLLPPGAIDVTVQMNATATFEAAPYLLGAVAPAVTTQVVPARLLPGGRMITVVPVNATVLVAHVIARLQPGEAPDEPVVHRTRGRSRTRHWWDEPVPPYMDQILKRGLK